MASMNKTIFYLSDEGSEAGKKAVTSTGVAEQTKRATTSGGSLEGLHIVKHKGERGSNVQTESATATGRLIRLPELGFLQSCCFCRRELSLCEDVYMYRGDQGFCSDECRSRRIDWGDEESLK